MKNKKLKTLQSDILIPNIVTEKAEKAFAMIQEGSAGHESLSGQPSAHSRFKKRWAAALVVILLSAGAATTSAAGYYRWSRSLERGLSISETDKKSLEESHIVSSPDVSVTDQGVTISAKECIIDKYSAYITFKIEGFELPEDRIPTFGSVDILWDGVRGFNGSQSFYDRVLHVQGKGWVCDDGTPIEDPTDLSRKERYVMDDGSMEYCIRCYTDKPSGLLGKQFHIEFTGIGTLDGKSTTPVFSNFGSWVLEWTLQGGDASKTFVLNKPLGDSGASAAYIEASPVSFLIGYDVDGIRKETPADIDSFLPKLGAVRTKSGRIISVDFHGISKYHTDGTYEMYTQTDWIVDTDEIESFWFWKEGNGYGNIFEPIEEDDFYIIPVN